jgi:hypothetical protein
MLEDLIVILIFTLPLEEYLFMMLIPITLIGGALIFKTGLHINHPKRIDQEAKE